MNRGYLLDPKISLGINLWETDNVLRWKFSVQECLPVLWNCNNCFHLAQSSINIMYIWRLRQDYALFPWTLEANFFIHHWFTEHTKGLFGFLRMHQEQFQLLKISTYYWIIPARNYSWALFLMKRTSPKRFSSVHLKQLLTSLSKKKNLLTTLISVLLIHSKSLWWVSNL
jgi:hypothetical protein